MNEKASKGHLSDEEEIRRQKLEKKSDDWLEDKFIENNSRKRQEEIAEGGPLGIPEAQEMANKENVAIEWTTQDGKTILITPEGQMPSKTIGVTETSRGMIFLFFIKYLIKYYIKCLKT